MNRPERLKVAAFYSYMCAGGDENRVISYLGAHDRERFELFVINGIQPDARSEELNGPVQHRIRDLGVPLINLGIPSDHQRRIDDPGIGLAASQGKNFLKMCKRLGQTLREHDIHLIDGRNNMGSLVGAMGGRLGGVHAVLSTNYELTRFHPKGCYQMGQAAYRLTDALVCDSQTCLDDMRDWMHSPPPGHLVPNGIVPPSSELDPGELRAQLGIPQDAIVIGQVARVQRIKGQDLLLKVAARLREQFPKIHVLIIGYRQQAQTYSQELEELIVDLGMQDAAQMVSWPGPIGDMWQLIDIHAHPTRQDSSPFALMEAMSLGKPIITTRIGGIHEIIWDRKNGRVIESDDEEALFKGLQQYLADPAYAAEMGAAAMAKHRAEHSVEHMARRQEEVYDEVFARPYRRG